MSICLIWSLIHHLYHEGSFCCVFSLPLSFSIIGALQSCVAWAVLILWGLISPSLTMFSLLYTWQPEARIMPHMLDFDSIYYYLRKGSQIDKHVGVGSGEIDVYYLFSVWCFCVFQRGQRDGSQGPDCLLNLLPVRQIIRDHAGHPSCWVCVFSWPFPTV